jgi:ABC-type glycerol-3-phosphate transport system permease component
VVLHLAAALLVGLLALPFFWTVNTALKTDSEALQYPPSWWPETMHITSFIEALAAAPFGRFYVNSLITALAATALQIGLALLMSYAFAAIRFPAKGTLLALVLATMLIPDELRLIPNYRLMARLDWLNTYWALIIPPAAHAFPVFVMLQQFRMVPGDLLDAANVDGAGHFRRLTHVAMPLSKPTIAAATLIAFLGRWNDFLWPLVVTDRLSMRTLPIGLAYLQDVEEGAVQWNVLMAGTLIAVLPVLAGCIFVQRYFVAGIMRGGLKA